MKTLNVYASLGETLDLGFLRDDVPNVIHTIARAAPGDPIIPSSANGGPHWPCQVCEEHGFTQALFYTQIQDALTRGPEDHR